MVRANRINCARVSFRYIVEWIFGWLLCKAVPYVQSVAVSASVNTLAAIAVERWANEKT